MRVAMFSAKNYERTLLDELNAGHGHDLVYYDVPLGSATVPLAAGFPAVSVFVNDVVNGEVLKRLAARSTKLVATRSTGFNLPRAYNRTRDGNFELDGLMGFDLVGRTVAVIGTSKIGTIFGRIWLHTICRRRARRRIRVADTRKGDGEGINLKDPLMM